MLPFKQRLMDEILPKVRKPLRYLGQEYNVIKKDWQSVKLRTLFAFPDVYEIGMSHLGLQILYGLVNEQADYLMERVFAPWPDLEKELRSRNLPLYSLESWRPLSDFDCLAFTLQYEMSYTNVLNILDLGGLALLACERENTDPLVMAGGPCAFHPEPLADFIDLFVLGEGEEVLLEILAIMARHRSSREGQQDKKILLKELAQVPGVYVPAFYDPIYDSAGKFRGLKSKEAEAVIPVVKRVVSDLEQAYFPIKPIVPFLEVVHDRMILEVLRGCTRGCRFCQAGFIYRPVRERSRALLLEQANQISKATGYNEISLTSLSTSDYSEIKPLLKDVLGLFAGESIGVSLPSLRVDSFAVDLAKAVQKVRKTGLTFAPEAGTQRLRDVINKNVTEADLMEVAEAVFTEGWTRLKLYFMLGLPTETEEDLDGIVALATQVLEKGRQIWRARGQKRRVQVTISVASFIPKPHTPFQWEAQEPLAVLEEKQNYLRSKIKDKDLVFNYHEAQVSLIEAVLAKGERRLGQVLKRAWQLGCRLDAWSEHFRYDLWLEAFQKEGLDPSEIANIPLNYESILPWDHLGSGVSKEYLWQEREKAYQVGTTADCRWAACPLCGVCQNLKVKTKLQKGE